MEQVVCDVDIMCGGSDADDNSSSSHESTNFKSLSDYNFNAKFDEKLDDNSYMSDPELNLSSTKLKRKPLLLLFKQMRVIKSKMKNNMNRDSCDSQIMQRYLNDTLSYNDNGKTRPQTKTLNFTTVSEDDYNMNVAQPNLRELPDEYEEEEDINGYISYESMNGGHTTEIYQIPREFTSSESYESTESNMKPKSFPCSHCPKIFSYRSALEKHKKLKHMMLKCRCCDQTFFNTEQAARHEEYHVRKIKQTAPLVSIKDAEKNVDSGYYECNICDKTFRKRPYLAKHLKRHAKGTLKRFNQLLMTKRFNIG